MLPIDLRGKRALVCGVADDAGFGFALAKELAEAGASVCLGTWPPALNIFRILLQRGKLDASLTLADGSRLAFEAVYPLDAEYDTVEDIPEAVRASRRYRDHGDVSIGGLAERLRADFGEPALDMVVHSLANAPEVKNPLLDTSRAGYLSALGVSAYSMVSLVNRLGPLVRSGGSFLALSYLAAQRVIPGYGGGMSSAKAALESDMRVLSFEAGRRWGHRVNVISAGPLASRAASAIGEIGPVIAHCAAHSPIPEPITASQVGRVGAFLCSPLAAGVTGNVVYVDNGYQVMGAPADGGL